MRVLNQHNYEEWALDFLEGKLNKEDLARFKSFLLLHPAIAEELDLLQESQPEVGADASEFIVDKTNLKRTLPEHLSTQSWDDLMIAVLENDVPLAERQLLLREFENSPGLQKDWAIYQATKVKPLAEELFLEKDKLYRRQGAKIISINRAFLLRAAVVVLLLGLGIKFAFQDNNRFRANKVNGFDLAAEWPLTLPDAEPSKQGEISGVEIPTNASKVNPASSDGILPSLKTAAVMKNSPDKISSRDLALIEPAFLEQRLLFINAPLLAMEEPGIALTSTEPKKNLSEKEFFDLNHPFRSVNSWVKRQGKKRLELPEDQDVDVPGAVEYASAGAALLEKLTGTTFALEPKFNKEGKMNDLSFRAGNYQLMLK